MDPMIDLDRRNLGSGRCVPLQKISLYEPCCKLSCIVSLCEVTFNLGLEGFN